MKETRSISRMAGAMPGFIVGVLWLAMAATALWTAARGHANQRSGWALGWGLVGTLLLAAALAALIGTWWHAFRVRRHPH